MGICLKADHLSKSFDALKVLDSWNVEVEEGERVGIIGPSGCGKTSFLRMAVGLDQPSQGKIVRKWKNTGYVFQEPRLIPSQTVRENLSFVCSAAEVDQMLEMLELRKFEHYYPKQLSGGMAQRVNLARALVNQPDFLILDEAFAAYDIDIKYRSIKKLVELWKANSFSMISVTHNIKDALMLSDRIIVVSQAPSKIRFEYRVRGSEKLDWTSPDMYQMEEELTRLFLQRGHVSEPSAAS